MNIDLLNIANEAHFFANQIIISNVQNKSLSAKERRLIFSEDILKSSEGRSYVDNIVLGSIAAYHEYLREILLEKGIDIGDLTIGGDPIDPS